MERLDNRWLLATITFNGTAGDDTFVYTPISSDSFSLVLNGGPTSIFSGVDELIVNGDDGDDLLIVDLSSGNPLLSGGIQFNGEGNGAMGDALNISGGSASQLTYTPNDLAGTAATGTIDLDGQTITFTGLEPTLVTTSATTVTIDLSSLAVAETVTLSNAVMANMSQVTFASNSLEDLAFTNPTSLLEVIGTGGASHTINVEGLDGAFSADLTIDADGDDTINFQSAATNIGAGSLDADGMTINVNQSITANGTIALVAAQDVAVNGNVSAGGAIDILAGNDISVSAGNVSAGGAIDIAAGNDISVGAGNLSAGSAIDIAAGNDFSVGAGNVSAGGAIDILAGNDISVGANVTGQSIVADAGGDVTVNAGAAVISTGGNVTLTAGDNATIDGDLSAAAVITINVDVGDADAAGGTVDIDVASVVASNGGTMINGGDENDTFSFAPRATTSFSVNGNPPAYGVPLGDTLNLDFSGIASPPILTLGATAGDGIYSFLSPDTEQGVAFTSIETLNSGGDPYHLVLDMGVSGFENGMDDTIEAQLNAAGSNLELLVNGGLYFETAAAEILSLTVIGSDDNDTFQVNETAGGLPGFDGQAPPVNNTGFGGGSSNGAHLSAAAKFQLDSDFSMAPFTAADVSIHFDGGGGDNSLVAVLTTTHDAAYFSDTVDAANSGNIYAASGAAAPDLLLSVANLSPISLTTPAGSLLVDATGTPATSSLTIDDDAVAGDGVSLVSGNGGFETTSFSGFDSLTVRGGNGGETFDLVELDSSTAVSAIELSGNNTFGNDGGADTLRVRYSPAGSATILLGGAGNDAFQLFDAALTVDNIQGPVTVDGQTGNDSLLVNDSGDAGPDTVLVTETTIDGLTGDPGSPDISYGNIDELTVTATAGNDTVTVDMTTGGSDLDNATINGAGGDDQIRLESFITGLDTITLNGNAGSDTFNEPTGPANPNPNIDPRGKLEPSLSTEIFVNGEAGPTGSGNPTSPPNGDLDVFNLDVTVLTAPVIVDTVAGVATSAGPHQVVYFSGMEDICLDDVTRDDVNFNIGELYVRTTDAKERVVFTSWNDSGVKVRIDDLDTLTSLTFPNHFGLVGGVQQFTRIVTFAQDGNDSVSIASHVRDGNGDPIPVEFHGENGDDYLAGANGNDILVGGPGDDRVLGGNGDNQMFGDGNLFDVNGANIEEQTDGNDYLAGRDGNDVMWGGGRNDRLYGIGGDDVLNAGSGNDRLDGGQGSDILRGGDGQDTLSGGYGNDVLLGGDGNDRLYGRQGNDIVIGGTGRDLISGNDGADLLVAGTTDQDDDSDAAWSVLLAAWSSSGANNLTGITGDGDRDGLQGGAGIDEFWAEILPTPPIDNIGDAMPGESVNNEA